MVGEDIASVIIRVALALIMFAHGWNHAFGGGKLTGTAEWFASIGMRPPRVQAALATATEIGVAPLLVLGLLTPLAAAGVIGVMVVALVTNHLKNGFFIFRPGEGYEYVLYIILSTLGLAALGGGSASIDALIAAHSPWFSSLRAGWWGLALAGGLGGGCALIVLAACWRPSKPPSSA